MSYGSLKHVGVPGMKWGVRKGSSGTKSRTRVGSVHKAMSSLFSKKKAAAPLNSSSDKTKKKDDDSESSADHEKFLKLKKKKLNEMSNDDVRFLMNRVQLESQYQSLHPNKMAAAKKIVIGMVGTAAKQAVQPYLNAFVAAKLGPVLSMMMAKAGVKMSGGKDVQDTADTAVEVVKTIANTPAVRKLVKGSSEQAARWKAAFKANKTVTPKVLDQGLRDAYDARQRVAVKRFFESGTLKVPKSGPDPMAGGWQAVSNAKQKAAVDKFFKSTTTNSPKIDHFSSLMNEEVALFERLKGTRQKRPGD